MIAVGQTVQPPYDEIQNIVESFLDVLGSSLVQTDEDPENFIATSHQTLDNLLDRLNQIDPVIGTRLLGSFQKAKELVVQIVEL